MSGTPNIRVEYLKNYKKVIDANFDSIAKMEKKRKIIKFLYILCMSLWIILCIYWDIKTPSSRLHKSDHFIWIIGILGAGFIHSFITFPFEKEVKPLLDKISVSFFDNLKSKKITNYPDSQLFTKSGVVDYFNKAKYYEYFVGNYDNIDYEIIFAKLKHLPKDETSVKRKFKGFIIRLKPLPGVNFHAIISTKTLNDFSMNIYG